MFLPLHPPRLFVFSFSIYIYCVEINKTLEILENSLDRPITHKSTGLENLIISIAEHKDQQLKNFFH